MERVGEEALKLLKSKMLWGLIGVFLAFNIFTIVTNAYDKNDINLVNKIVEEVGLNLNGDGEAKLKKYAEVEMAKASRLVEEKTGKKEVNLEDILNGFGREKFSEEELNQIGEAAIVESYYYTFLENIKKYNGIDVLRRAKEHIESLDKVSEFTKEEYMKGFEKFNKRLQEIKDTGENKFLSINGIYRINRRLYNDNLIKLGGQALILIVIATSFLFNYEFENKTSHIVYSAKNGRSDKDKLRAILMVGLLFVTILIGVTLTVFFTVYDFSGVFNSPINSVFNWETNFPQLSWVDVTVREYLIINIIIIYIVSIMSIFITTFVSKVFKNTYITFFVCAIIYGILYILPNLIKFDLVFQGMATYNPVILIRNLGYSLSMFSTIIPNKWFEVITVVIWTGLIIGGYFIFDKKFKGEDI